MPVKFEIKLKPFLINMDVLPLRCQLVHGGIQKTRSCYLPKLTSYRN